MAVAAYVAFGEILMLWGVLRDGSLAGSPLHAVVTGVLLSAMLVLYGCGFVSAYLSGALSFAAVVAAVSVWRLGRVPAAYLAALVATCPAIVFVQASTLGLWFDPGAETESDALTPLRALVLFSSLLLPALIGAWLIVGRRQGWGPIAHGARRGLP